MLQNTMSIWVTGFEAFGALQRNPTAMLIEALAESPPVVGLRVMLLPVCYTTAEPLLEEILATRPRLWIGLGAHPGAGCFELERIGLNLDDTARPDQRMEVRRESPIRPGRPDAHCATLPLAELRDALLGAGVPAIISNTASSYLCNHSLFYMLDRSAELGLANRCGFFHLPLFPDQATRKTPPTPSMSIEVQLRGLAVALSYCLS